MSTENKEDYTLEKAKEFALKFFNDTFSKFPKGGKIDNATLIGLVEAAVTTGYNYSKKFHKD